MLHVRKQAHDKLHELYIGMHIRGICYFAELLISLQGKCVTLHLILKFTPFPNDSGEIYRF